MAGQAGWYRAPGEDGLLRYWNGTLWTEHRQPVPPVAPPTPRVQRAPDPMAEYERQFDQPPTVVLPEHETASLFTPASRPPFAMTALAQAPTVTSVAPASDRPADSDRNRRAVRSALRGMVIGAVIVVIGLIVMGLMSVASFASAGEVKASGIVTSLGSTANNACTPIARFAVEGKSYTANSSVGISPCSVGLGQTVDIVYSAADPASGARIEIGAGITQFTWVIPLLGALVFFGSMWAFILRAGSIAAGIAMIRGGNKRTKEHVA